MPALSLRLVSVVICVVLTLITAVLTLAVSTSFTTKAVNDIGQRYSSSLAANLKANVVSYLQKAVDQYSSLAEYTRTRPTGTPNSTWSPTWNGSFWTFNPADLSQVEPYYAMKLQTMVSHNFSRESSTVTCFADGTWLQVTKNTFFPGPAFYTSTIAGLPDGRALDWTTMTYSSFLFYGEDRKPYAPFPGFLYPSTPDPWAMPITSCSAFTTCSNLDCRGAPSYIEAASYGPERCFWVVPQLSIWPSIANGVYCTMFNSLDQRLGVTGSLMQLTAVSDFVAGTQRTANGQAFVVDSTNWGLLGSTYVQAFQGAWVYGNVTIDYFAPQLQELRNGSGFPITLVGAGTGSSDQPGMPFTGALVMNATYLKVKPNCQIGIFTPHIVCQETVDTYQYQPLRSLRDAIGLDPAVGFRQGSIAADGETYYYAVDGITTRMQGAEVPGLRWSVVVLTPQQDVLGEVSKGRTYSIVATCCFFVFAAGCCFALFTVFLRPLVDLEDRMLLTANLADDSDKSEDVSALSEIRNMQKSFYRMRAQLRKLKSFVPQSVLAALDDDDDDEGGVEGAAVSANLESGRASEYLSEGSSPAGDNRMSMSRNKDGTQTATDTKTSHSKRSSSKHSVITGSGVAVRALNMQLGLTKKMVSVMVFNIMGLHSAIKSRTVDEVTLLHSKLVDSFSTIVSGGKGIVDSFQGDRFVATFNAVTNNAQHAVRAAVAAQEMLAAFARLRSPFPRAGVGIATGEALVGNGGCDTMRRFCTIGRVYTQATVIERLTKQHASADVLLTQGTASQLAHEFYIEALDVLQFEGQSKPSLVYALRDRMNHAMEEWNYAMKHNEDTDKYGKLNEAFTAYCDGDPTQARAVLAAVPEAGRQSAGYVTLSSLLEANTDPAARASRAQGLFFGCCVGSPAALERTNHTEPPPP